MPLFTSDDLGLGLVSSSLGHGLVILVLVLRIWSCLHHCNTLSQKLSHGCLSHSLMVRGLMKVYFKFRFFFTVNKQ